VKFSRLKFYDDGRSIQAIVFFDNGYGASIVQGPFASSNRVDDTYEIAVLAALKPYPKGHVGEDSEIVRDTNIGHHGVLGYLSRNEVESVLEEIAALPPRRPGRPSGPREREGAFAIHVYDQRHIEDNARDTFGPENGEPEDRKEAMKADFVDADGEITPKGWDLLSVDIVKLEKNSFAWLRKKFRSAREEGYGRYDDLVGTFWFDVFDPVQAALVQLGIDERIDMTDTSYGDLGDSVWHGTSKFAGVLGGHITFQVEADVIDEIEEVLDAPRAHGWRAR
jgi:hypothetical protein